MIHWRIKCCVFPCYFSGFRITGVVARILQQLPQHTTQPQVCTSGGNNISHSNNSSLDNSKVNCKVNTGTNNSTIGNISNTQLQQQLISPRATHVRRMEIEEELLTIEKTKIDIMKENLAVQRGILECLQSLSASTIFHSLH